MGIGCLFGHKWNGCTCARCGTVRDQEHSWQTEDGKCEAKCAICGRVSEMPHKWEHDEWSLEEKCAVCGRTRKDPDYTGLAVSLIRSADMPKRGDETWNGFHKIGEQLNKYGGMDAMRNVCMIIYQEDSVRGRTLESIWGGIGEWMG